MNRMFRGTMPPGLDPDLDAEEALPPQMPVPFASEEEPHDVIGDGAEPRGNHQR